MSYCITYVVRYPDAKATPTIECGMLVAGGELIACQFSDALKELELFCELADQETYEKVAKRLIAEKPE